MKLPSNSCGRYPYPVAGSLFVCIRSKTPRLTRVAMELKRGFFQERRSKPTAPHDADPFRSMRVGELQ